MASTVTLSGTPTEDAALGYTLSPPGGTAVSQAWESSADKGTTWVPIPGATNATFTPGDEEVGKSLRVVVQVDDGTGASAATSNADVVANVNDAPTGTFTISGTATQGQTLTSADLVSDPDGATGPRSYHWEVQTAPDTWTKIDGATDSTFTLTQATVGKSVRAVVSFTDNKGSPESVNSNVISNIADANIAPGGTLKVEGTLKVGQTVNMADLVYDEDGIAPDGRSYQWQVSADGTTWTNLEGASGNQPFVLTDAQVGRSLRAVLNYTDGDGKAETVLGTASAPVTAAGNSAPTGTLALDDGPGDAPREDVAITADASGVKDADGLGAFTYAWSREAAGGTWTPIAGATGASYTPGDADVGARLKVEASYTDGGGTKETVSAVSAVVVAAPTGKAITLPPPEPGETQENAAKDEWTSVDLAKMIAEGGTFAPPAGVERVELADGVLSYGTGTPEAFIARLYLGLLGREGDVSGLSFTADLAEAGVSRGGLAGVILSSAEYGARHGNQTDLAFVEGLYKDCLGRAGDAREQAFWVDALQGGASRAGVAASIVGSAEAADHMKAATTGVFVPDYEGASARGLYKCALGREGDAAGVAFWANVLEQGFSIKTLGDGFDGTAEFEARHGALTNKQYVEKLYQDGLGRTADAGGLDYWTGLLDSGQVGRGELAVIYATTEEVRNGLDWPL